MKSLYRYSKERHYAKPPEAIWPFVADTARINELSGSPIYQVEERADADGRIHRLASVGIGPIRLRWEDGYSEWQENRRIFRYANSATAQSAASRRRSTSIRTAPEAGWCIPPTSSAPACSAGWH